MYQHVRQVFPFFFCPFASVLTDYVIGKRSRWSKNFSRKIFPEFESKI